MPKVALFVADFLSYSKTFIYEEIRQHARYQVEVFTRRRVAAEQSPFEPVHVAGRLYKMTRFSPKFDRLFRTRRYDLVHAHFGTAGIFAMRYAHKHGLPLVVTFHGFDVPLLSSTRRYFPDRWGYALLGRPLLRQMTLGLCASGELRELLLELGVAEHKLRVHRLGVDLRTFRPPEPGLRDEGACAVTMIGRFADKKGFQYGIRAFARVARAHPAARLSLVGTGENEQRLRDLVAELELADRVCFHGVLSGREVAEHLRQVHILLAPSVVTADGNRESGLMVVKEASATGVVPIGTYHGGIPEIIEDGRTGFLVPERDVEALAERLGWLVADAELRRRMGEAARAKMEREYDNTQRVAVLEALYDEARELAEASPRP
jgi:colanic acid/amylovoran biosynthesis glycosyltransferase